MARPFARRWMVSLAGSLLLSGAAFADCTYPRAPDSIPDGTTASEAEMAAAAAAFKQYNADVTAYLGCLQQETATRSAGVSPGQAVQIKSLQSKKHNAAVDELESKVAKFNEQVRVFKNRRA